MISDFETFRNYLGVSRHFESPSYDGFKYDFWTKVSPDALTKRNDRYFFSKLGNKMRSVEELRKYLSAQKIAGVRNIIDMLDHPEIWDAWNKRNANIHYHLRETLSDLPDMSLEDLLLSAEDSSAYPKIVELFIQKEVSPEAVVILDSLTDFLNIESKKRSDPILWNPMVLRFRKYKPFIKFDLKKSQAIVEEKFCVAC